MCSGSHFHEDIRAKKRQLSALQGRIKRGGDVEMVRHYQAVAKELQAEVAESPDSGSSSLFLCECVFLDSALMCSNPPSTLFGLQAPFASFRPGGLFHFVTGTRQASKKPRR